MLFDVVAGKSCPLPDGLFVYTFGENCFATCLPAGRFCILRYYSLNMRRMGRKLRTISIDHCKKLNILIAIRG
jgi:hypothetical protein